MDEVRVLVGIPCKGAIELESEICIDNIENCTIRKLQSSLVDDAREMIANEAIEQGYTHLMFIDSDMVFSPEDVYRLITLNLDCVSGIAFKRTPPYTPCFYRFKEGTEGKDYKDRIEVYSDYPQDTLFEVDGIGSAFQLIKVDCLKKVKETFGTMFWRDYPLGEDLSFCKRMKECGYKIYADSRIKIGHLSKVVITENTWLRAKAQMEKK